jgi:hypothetical protein
LHEIGWTAPILYSAGIGGTGIGFWKSTDGGVSWTNYRVAPGGERQGFYPPVVNPYDPNHLLMTGHQRSLIVQSFDGRRHWSEVAIADGKKHIGGTGFIFFIDTRRAGTTTDTWIWTAEATGGKIGTWRPSDPGGVREQRLTATSTHTGRCRSINRTRAASSSCRGSIRTSALES